jgi:hypothetical protein
MSRMCISFAAYNHTVYKGCFDVINLSVNRVSTIFCLTHSAIKGLHCHIIQKWMAWLALYQKLEIIRLGLYPWIEHQWYLNRASTIFGIASWNIQRVVQCHSLIIKLLAAFLGKHGYGNIATAFQKSVSTEGQQLLALHLWKCESCAATLIHNRILGRHFWPQQLWQQATVT